MATTAKTPTTPPTGPAPDAPTTDADRIRELEAENAKLREQLAAAGQRTAPARPSEPSFVFSEGQRAELEETGRTVSPFTGDRFVGTGPDDARKATAKEFAEAKPATDRTTRKN